MMQDTGTSSPTPYYLLLLGHQTGGHNAVKQVVGFGIGRYFSFFLVVSNRERGKERNFGMQDEGPQSAVL